MTLSLSEQDLINFKTNGVVRLKQAIDTKWLEILERGVDHAVQKPTPLGREFAKNQTGSYRSDMYLSVSFGDFKDFSRNSNLGQIGAFLLESKKIILFNDELLLKEPNTSQPTPWHHDLTYWPLGGFQVISVWIPLDAVYKDSGALDFIKGSHHWGKRFSPRDFDDGKSRVTDSSEEKIPNLDSIPESSIFSEELVPGDCLVFHALTLHRASGNNRPDCRRRAVVIRLLGDDVTFQPRPRTIPFIWAPNLAPGEYFPGKDPELFPVLWPSSP